MEHSVEQRPFLSAVKLDLNTSVHIRILLDTWRLTIWKPVHRKSSIEIRDEMYRITDRSFLRCTTFGTTKQNLVFVVARRFFNSASFEVNSLIPQPF